MVVGGDGEKYAGGVMDLLPRLDLRDVERENDEYVVGESCGGMDGSVRLRNRRVMLEVLDTRRSAENVLRLVVVVLVGDAAVVAVAVQVGNVVERRRRERKREKQLISHYGGTNEESYEFSFSKG